MSSWTKPANASELTALIGADWDEGVIVALFPCPVESHYMLPELTFAVSEDKQTMATPVMSHLGVWGDRMIDLVLTTTTTGLVDEDPQVPWAAVRDAAKELRLNEVPQRWAGPISEIPDRYFDIPVGTYMGFRFMAHGPWVFPLESPPEPEETP